MKYHKIVMTRPLATVPWSPQNKKQNSTGNSPGSAVVTDKQLKLLRHMTSQARLLEMPLQQELGEALASVLANHGF